ncbi:uncharacterized protein LOC134682157 [Mytilus trossulus]|uniref:uncharacterized protein LOC134682157 n=1 Tax=Mytilus trossulus TaxID=6551 RepID=UPI003005A989
MASVDSSAAETEPPTAFKEMTAEAVENYTQAQIPVNNFPSAVTLRRQITFECHDNDYFEIIDCAFVGLNVVFPDYINDRLIISMVESNDIRYFGMDYRPKYITGVNNNTVAVGCTRYVIQIIDISNDTVVRTFPTSGECYGISCSEDTLYVDASNIVVMDLMGLVLRTFPKPGIDLGYLTVDGDRFFFCDGFTLFCCDLSGNVKWEFDKEGYKDIYGMATDSKGNVYLANADSDRIVVISPDGRLHKDILTRFDSLESPISLDFDKKENRLVVRTTANESAFIFDVAY